MQIPLCLVGKTAQSLEMEAPRLQEFLQSSLIVRGHSYAESRQYLRQSLSSYFARTILLDRAKTKGNKDVIKKVPPNKNPVKYKKFDSWLESLYCPVKDKHYDARVV